MPPLTDAQEAKRRCERQAGGYRGHRGDVMLPHVRPKPYPEWQWKDQWTVTRDHDGGEEGCGCERKSDCLSPSLTAH